MASRARVDEHYRERVTGETLMVNELYLSVVYRPQAGMVQGAAMKLLSRSNKANEAQKPGIRSMPAPSCVRS